jgi:hypothetical protein
MAVGDQEQRAVARTGAHGGEQPGKLLKGEKIRSRKISGKNHEFLETKRGGLGAASRCFHVISLISLNG